MKNINEILNNLQNPTTQHFNIKDNILSSLREEYNCYFTILQLKTFDEFKIDTLICFIKSIFIYNEDVSILILSDDTGQIKANIYTRLIDEYKISTNKIIMLKKCSLWKINEIQVNIVDENIIEIL